MQKYAIITNEETKACSVGIGTNEAFYKSIGMTLQDVEQAYDGTWYLVGYVPEEPAATTEEVEAERRNYREKNSDYLTLRKVRKTALGEWTDADEEEYVNTMKDIEALIEQQFPYPTTD